VWQSHQAANTNKSAQLGIGSRYGIEPTALPNSLREKMVAVKRLVHRFGVPTESATSRCNCGIGK